ncbi:acyl-CoA dehydrogenase-like protein [Pandoraea thiooxydans]|uniref:Acyl-CoA dehydrogenase n=1 Tax=Pandoraea thiooxydans TaxID=445709 RepID=A0A0G3ERH0_9BURK|nr:acyl-CoA dehydrogenase family protein [Pandoraea thiooxydans]AKJ67311.1 hypothetical protein ABW99_02775 [Pandoraea thiooxydans]APR94322.1 acyl-CoA dehydrogenase-like protein [Pandoraea thiooxydans]
MQDMLAEAMERLLADICQPETIRALEAGQPKEALWTALADAGFADALSPEAAGGAGLSLREAVPLIESCARHALPLPLPLTMVVRAALAETGAHSVAGPITIAAAAPQAGSDGIRCARVPFGAVADWIVVDNGLPALWPVHGASIEGDGIYASLDADIVWPAPPGDAVPLPLADWQAIAACVSAVQMAGAMTRILEMTIAYANDRSQFGRPIGKFQALQQQISVLAERVFATRMAACIGCAAQGWRVERAAAALAKGYASEAATLAASIAHAVHGAIGITAEFALQSYTRRLHAWRLAYGAESYWHGELGELWLAGKASALDFVRTTLSPAAT